jgi:hypothetical protein
MNMTNWKSVRIGCAAALLALLMAASGQAAWDVTHENKLAFNRAVSLPGVVLAPGT